MKSFSTYHPIVNIIYFISVIAFTMVFIHPVFLAISLLGSFMYSTILNGKKAVRFNLVYMLPMMITAAILNPVFNHEGVTILTYLPGGNPLTAESIFFGIAAAIMIGNVICWFSCYNAVMTSDKFIYLFGKIIPSLSLIFSMALRFIPKFKQQFKVVSNSQKCIGRDISTGSIKQRTKHTIRIISIMITWSLENAVETADSMKSRGYGLNGRTSFSIYKFTKRDTKALCAILIFSTYIVVGSVLGGTHFSYFPSIKYAAVTPFTISLYVVWLILCIMPAIIEFMEEIKWNALKSKI